MTTKFAMASGALVDLDNFTKDSFCLNDIAHHLAKIQRYNGALPIDTTYSVGEHCINLALYFMEHGIYQQARLALIHDASEAMMADIPSYLKNYLKDYKNIERLVESVIYTKYLGKINISDIDIVKEADKRIVIDEVEHIMPRKAHIYKAHNKQERLGCTIMYDIPPKYVCRDYLRMCILLGIRE